MHLSSEETSRYSRHLLLPQIGAAGQLKLKQAKVLVIGTGGLGSPISLYLAAAGVGTLGLAEFDKVDVHNLQRQILFSDAEVGTPKLGNAIRRLQALNPYLNCIAHAEGIRPENAVELFRQYDVIVDGTDNFPTRYLNNDAAVLAGKPLVYGSVLQFEGQVSVFAPHLGGPCYRCLFPEPPQAGEVPNCAEAGVLGALCGTVGSLQAMEAIKLITDAGKPLLNRLLVIDALSMQFRTINIKADPECPLCGKNPNIRGIDPERYNNSCAVEQTVEEEADYPWEISAVEASECLKGDSTALLLDVREDYERHICAIERSLDIPLNTLLQNPDRVPRDVPVFCLCHYGMRSMYAVKFLREKGFHRVSNIAGGIHAWANDVEPTMPRY